MKYYKLKKALKIDGKQVSNLNGEHVKNRESFFDKDKSGPNKFYDKLYEFDYLIPVQYGADDEDEPGTAIYDIHPWRGKEPWGGWFTPVSKRFKEVLEQFNLGEFRFYPAKVLFEGVKHEYYVLQIFYDYYISFVDFDKTLFNNLDSSRELCMPELELKKFNSIPEMKKYAKEHWDSDYNYERIVMKPEFKEVDMVTFYRLGDIVSERLKAAIEKAGLKGIEFEELPIPIEFSDEV